MIFPRHALALTAAAMLTAGCNPAVISGWTADGTNPVSGEGTSVPFGDDDSGMAIDDPEDPEAVVFRPDIQQDLEDEGCLTCHQRAGTPMQVTPEPGSEGEWRDNYDEVVARAGSSTASLLIDKATGAGGHGAFLDASSPVLARWRAWVSGGTMYEDAEPPGDPSPASTDAGVPEEDAGTTPPPTGDDPVAYTTDIAPIIESNGCTRCHGSSGSYDLSSFSDVIGSGSDDVPNVIAGDADSVLIDYCRNGHQGIGYRDALTVMEWVVDWGARQE
ncbi:MAG: hypothetical protein JRH11_05410 [Deltaproteobacteria bacterium]|nr:hypothetical protein [Deltaproteobacteria bacterium]